MVGKTVTDWLDLDPGLIRRVIATTTWLGVLLFLIGSVYIGFVRAGTWGLGVLLGVADLILIRGLIRALIHGAPKWRFALYFVTKSVVLTAVGALFLLEWKLDPVLLASGFSLFLGVAILKIFGRLLLASRWMSVERQGTGGRFLRESPGAGSRR